MKILIITLTYLCLFSQAKAQDTSLYQGECTLYFHTGKVLKKIKLWGIDTVLVTYVLKGNLNDVRVEDVRKIETPEYNIVFDSKNRMSKKFLYKLKEAEPVQEELKIEVKESNTDTKLKSMPLEKYQKVLGIYYLSMIAIGLVIFALSNI